VPHGRQFVWGKRGSGRDVHEKYAGNWMSVAVILIVLILTIRGAYAKDQAETEEHALRERVVVLRTAKERKPDKADTND
jgi:hypothetical protein